MEKVRYKSLIILGIMMAMPAMAGVVLVSPPPPGDPNVRQSDDDYPDSRWGKAPIRVKTGVGEDYVANATVDLDTPEDDGTHASVTRSPAGLVFTDAMAGSNIAPAKKGPAAKKKSNDEPMQDQMTGSMSAGMSAPINIPMADDKSMNPEPSGATRRKGVQEISVIAGDLGFFPKTIFVVRDIPVRMFVTGASKNTLCIMMDSFQVRKQIRAKKIEEITFTPNTPGRFRFYCPVNGMEGTMIVKELASNLE